MSETETLYVKVRKEVKDKLDRMAKEQGRYLVDVASEVLEVGLRSQGLQGNVKNVVEENQSIQKPSPECPEHKDCPKSSDDSWQQQAIACMALSPLIIIGVAWGAWAIWNWWRGS